MKNTIKKALVCFTVLGSTMAFAQVGIGTTNPSSKSILDLTATDKGLLLPRMTTSERIAIAPTAVVDKGLHVFDTDLNATFYWNGTLWVEVSNKNIYTDNGTIAASTNRNITLGDRVTSRINIAPAGEEPNVAILNVVGGAGGATTGILLSSNYTNNTLKFGSIKVPQYLNSSPPVQAFTLTTSQLSNLLSVGGNGSSTQASPSEIFFNVDGDNNLANTAGESILNAMIIKGITGNVGIGTQAPTAKLSVVETNTTALQSTLVLSSNPLAGGASGFNGGTPDIAKHSSGIQFRGWGGLNEGGIFRQTGSANKSHLWFTVNNTNDPVMTLTQNLNVGIGTENPAVKLEVRGAIKIGSEAVAVPVAGMMRYNATTDKFEGYVNDADVVTVGLQPGWVNLN